MVTNEPKPLDLLLGNLVAMAIFLTPVFWFVRPAWVMCTYAMLIVLLFFFCPPHSVLSVLNMLLGSDNTDVLPPAEDATGQVTPQANIFRKMIGRTGTAVTLLRPGGEVRVDDRLVCALAENGVIRKGTPIVVVDADSMNLIVREADTDIDVTEQSDTIA